MLYYISGWGDSARGWGAEVNNGRHYTSSRTRLKAYRETRASDKRHLSRVAGIQQHGSPWPPGGSASPPQNEHRQRGDANEERRCPSLRRRLDSSQILSTGFFRAYSMDIRGMVAHGRVSELRTAPRGFPCSSVSGMGPLHAAAARRAHLSIYAHYRAHMTSGASADAFYLRYPVEENEMGRSVKRSCRSSTYSDLKHI